MGDGLTMRADNPIEGDVFVGVRGTRQRRGVLDGLSLKDMRPHDFRRTAASMMTSAGVSRLVVSKVLNHAEKGIESASAPVSMRTRSPRAEALPMNASDYTGLIDATNEPECIQRTIR